MIDKFEKYNLPLYGVRVPEIKFDIKTLTKYGLGDGATNIELFKAICNKSFRERCHVWKREGTVQLYKDRIKREVEALDRLNFIDYILVVWDFINFANEQGIPVGPGRGSAAGSLALNFLGITSSFIDPIKYGLYFERFVSEVRAKKKVVDGVVYLDSKSAADIDVDLCYYRRREVIDYLDKKFPNRTCKMMTVGTLQGKNLIKDCGKIIAEKKEEELMEITPLINVEYGNVEDISDTYNRDETFHNWCDENPLVYKTALALRENIRNKGQHASGLIVSYSPLDESMPIELSSGKEVVSSYTMEWAMKTSLKCDLLGLKSISVIDDCCKQIGIKYQDIDVESYEKIYSHLQDLKYPYGIFQVEAPTNFRVCQKVKPKNLSQLGATLSIGRPGAIDGLDSYVKYVEQGIYSDEGFFSEVLKETGGTCLFQEQQMAMAVKLGFSLSDADELRRCIGKKDREGMALWEEKIKNKCKENNIDPSVGDELWSILQKSANYSLNASHAISYGSITALCVYLKFNHPKEFFLSLLRMAVNESESLEEIATISKEMKHFGIQLLGPDLLKSNMDFSIEGENVRFGLSAVKHISEKVMDKLINFRKEYGSMVEMFCAAKESGISIGVLAALIQAGAMSSYQNGLSRSKLVLYAQTWNLLTDREKVLIKTLSENTNEQNILKLIKECVEERKDEKGKPLIKQSRFETIKKHYEPYKAIYEQNSKNEKLSSFVYEVGVLGFSYSEKLAEIYKETNPLVLSIQEAKEAADKESVLFVGIVKEVISRKSKSSGNPYIKLTVTDQDSQCDVLLFSGGREDKIEKCRENNGGLLPKEEDCVIIRGNKKGKDAFYVEDLGIQQNVVFTSLRELTKAKKKEKVEESANNLEQSQNPT